MPHPDYQIADVSLRLDQVSSIMRLIEDEVATGRGKPDYWAGPMIQLLGALDTHAPDATYLRPGPMHWLWDEVKR